MRKLFTGAALVVVAISVNAESPVPKYAPHVFVNGNDYMAWSQPFQVHFLLGVLDGLDNAPIVAGRDLPQRTAMRRCEEKMQMTPAELYQIVDNYMRAKPELWGNAMALLEAEAVNDSCTKVGDPFF